MSVWCVYMLRCRDGSLYTGATNNLEQRLARHQRGKGAAYTRSRLPVRLVYREAAEDRSAALRREAALKNLSRPEKLTLVRTKRQGVTGTVVPPRRRPSRTPTTSRRTAPIDAPIS